MAAPFRLLPVVLFVGLVPVALPRPAFAADGPAGGVALIPEDAAFVSATLRLREQWERVVKSNAFASLKKLPFVQRALDQLEEQKLQPGSPLSMVATFMELPENQQAIELLEDMVSTDTFLYGEPSCVQFVELLQRVERARQAANILQATQGGMDFDFDLDVEVLEGGGAAAQPGVRVQPVQLVRTAPDERTGRMILQTLADNAQLIVVPDLVWGFKTEKLPAAESQLKRIEVLVKLFTQANPDLAESLQRRKIAGGEVVTFTIDGETLPWDDMLRELTEGMDGDALEKVLERLRSLDLVIGLGVIGDRVVLSIGDSADHLDKLGSANGGQRLIATKPFAPLAGPAAKDRKITGVSYLSEPLVRAMAWSEANIDEFAEMVVDAITAEAELPEDGVQEARKTVAAIAASYKKRLPVPGAWMSYSFMSDRGYEGFVWDWTRNRVLDGSKRLDLLEHTGGAPLGAIVFRAKNDKEQFEDVVAWGGMVWKFFTKYGLAKADDEDRERVGLIEKHLGPVVDKFVGTLRTKLLPALADGQIGFVLDAKSRTKRLQNALPEASDPLPLLEPAIMLGLDDAKLFREGLSDLFSLSDDLVDAVREIDPDSVPADYRVKDPEKAKVEGGSVWTWPLEKSGLDEQVRPAIGVGEDVAVLSLVPKQASRLLAASKLETGSQLSKFEEPLVAAAALDMAGIIDAIQPWIVYLTRYGCVQQRDGEVDRDTVLTKEVEHAQATDALAQVSTVCEALKSLRAAVAEMATVGDASVTHWQNVIRDLPAK